MSEPQEPKRYNLALPSKLFDNVNAVAEEEHTTMLEVIKRFLKLGLLLYNAQKNGARLLIQEEGKTTEVFIIL